MKLVIGGSSGFVGAELVRQALSNPAITSVVGLSRRETPVPSSDANAAKLKSVVCDDFGNYSETVKKELEDVDAFIWTIAVTPTKLKTLPWEETVKISKDYAIAAVQTVASLPRKKDRPLRFVYMSGHFATRERTEQVKVLGDYGMMEYGYVRVSSSLGGPWYTARCPNWATPMADSSARRSIQGEAESLILALADESKGLIQSCVTKSGFINSPGRVAPNVPGLPLVELRDIVAAMLDQVVNGFEKDTLSNDDLVRIGKKALGEQ